MAEIPAAIELTLAPRLTYDADQSVLSLVTEPHENPIARHEGQYERALESASTRPGYVVAMDGLKSVLSIDIDALREYPGGDVDEQSTLLFLQTLYGTSFYDRPDEHGNYDSVFTPGGQSARTMGYGLMGAIYPGMQRWLNDPERLTDEVSHTVLQAMLAPFDTTYSAAMLRHFTYESSTEEVSASCDEVRIAMAPETVDLFILEGKGFDTWTQEAPVWHQPSLTTYDGATWMTLPSARSDRLFVNRHTDIDMGFLYQLAPSRVGYGAQMLSLVLGAAQLATIVGNEPVAPDTLRGPEVARSNS